ncbi:Stealth protein CR2, conserved region 2/Stealth protein CR3, conserved region 3, putative [Leishmania shawi]|uniref:Stealth protein CR2, conserved region 2/Stealth protein CR3, conserved region 3 n=1 Tax=Leishmania shawi TaxID=5680 RepID=A0ABR3E6C5_9TRYP
MLYSPSGATERFCYSGAAGEGSNVEQEFLRVAASYVSSPYEGPAGAYYNFFAAHHATLWTVDAATRVATPMRLDVVYTFVNPTASSFRRNLEARHVPLEQRRYRDWEELRYSLRSLRQFVLASGAFAQYHHRHAADVQRLSELGYQVNVSDAGVVDGVVSLVRRVYLVLSDTDQMPAWLDTEKFPELRVVTHADMFSAEEAAWVLPTLNSNVIESGLHRIPGISRFFLYFNNDMIVGRQLSFFDLFRPLSPPRQILEMANLQQADGVADVKTAQPYSDDTRVALFFETIFNSDGYVPPPSRSTLARIGARLVPQSWCAHLADVRPTGGLADRALRLLCTPAKISRPEQRGDALNHFARYCVQEELPGIAPSIEYAHMPRTFDREVLRMFSDDPISGFGVAVKEMRKAYIRDMNSFSPVHIYESFALAMRRARTAALWCQSDVRCAASLRPMHPLTTRKWRQRRTESCPGHPLEGGSQAVRLQHSDMLARWNSYEEKWLSSITTLPTSATETSQGSLSRSGVSAQNTATPLSASAPKQLYEPSQVVRMFLSERTARAPHKVSYQMISGCQHGGPVDASRVQSLMLDVHHHVFVADLTFSFFIVEDFQRLAIILSHLEHIAGSGTAPRASTLPLFITVNDDLESGVLDKQLHENHLMGWNRSHLTHAAFRRLLWLCSYMAPQAPWELWPVRV